MSGMAVVDDLVFLQGVGATKQTLRRWNQSPWRVIRPWIAWSAAVALALLAGTYAVATISTPDPSGIYIPGLRHGPRPEEHPDLSPQEHQRPDERGRDHPRRRAPPGAGRHPPGQPQERRTTSEPWNWVYGVGRAGSRARVTAMAPRERDGAAERASTRSLSARTRAVGRATPAQSTSTAIS